MDREKARRIERLAEENGRLSVASMESDAMGLAPSVLGALGMLGIGWAKKNGNGRVGAGLSGVSRSSKGQVPAAVVLCSKKELGGRNRVRED